MTIISQAELQSEVEALCQIERPSASAGERRSADWIAERLAAANVASRLEEEPATGSFWLPYSLLAGAGLLGAGIALKQRRAVGGLIAATAAAALVDDLALGPRLFRRLLRHRRTWNVVAELGPSDAGKTIVLVTHHDAPRSGVVFDPSGGEWIAARAPQLVERLNTDPPVFWPVIAGPGLTAAGAWSNRRPVLFAGMALSTLSVAAFLDIARRAAVPGAIDNASGVVALLALAHRLRLDPPDGVRVLLVFTGSEEALWEGIEGFVRRHRHILDPSQTIFVNVDQVGDRWLCFLRGEGPVWIRHYGDAIGRFVDQVADDLGIEMPFKRLRSRSGSDAQVPAKVGYPTVSLQSVSEVKLNTAYHWPTDVPEIVNYETLGDAVRLCEAIVRRIGRYA
jgi:acetylornithine deacetylase/succinyl-diaminopimelate desuccinylase-like protein